MTDFMTLEKMRNMDIRDIDPMSVVDAGTIIINTELPKEQRMMNVAAQMNGNPYFIKCGNILVKISHMETSVTCDERMEGYLRTL